MGSSAKQDYCAFTKAVEHLGDRWSLLIVRELLMFGPQGFNQLAEGLPGAISRSVLSARLRKLEELGLIARDPRLPARHAPYRLAPAGEQLIPTLKSLWDWAEHWVPEDAAMAQRDPTVIMWWLARRVDPAAVPARQVVLDFTVAGAASQRCWLVLTHGAEASLCLEDPLLGEDRYVYVEADAEALLPVARGVRSWTAAIAERSVRVYGDPELVRQLPGWFTAGTSLRASQPSSAAAVA